jgi:hypothetical protein
MAKRKRTNNDLISSDNEANIDMTVMTASYLELHLEVNSEDQLRMKQSFCNGYQR